ncbi:MAG: hypothetical protein KC457_37085, partial [Myxococcales bacterium]|nr:hypothetical protein [Myxococcales bacterium]
PPPGGPGLPPISAPTSAPAPIRFDGPAIQSGQSGPSGGGVFSGNSVSIVMPAPDGSVMASIGTGPRNFTILRSGKTHGPYDLNQLQSLVPMGKLRSVDTVVDVTSGMELLAVDVPGMRPVFEAKAREADLSTVRPLPQPQQLPPPESRGGLWMVIGLLAAAVLAAVAFLMLR